jgi:hypothetical protein
VRQGRNQHIVQQAELAKNFGRLEDPNDTGLVDFVGL